MLYTWDDYYWASNVLLAELIDGGTFHERSQYFLKQWVCGYNQLVRPFCIPRACKFLCRPLQISAGAWGQNVEPLWKSLSKQCMLSRISHF